MKLFPYYFGKAELSTKTLGKYNLISLHVLLEDGVKAWEEISNISAEEACESNDMKIRNLFSDENKAWIQINENETSLEDFFTYEEMPKLEPGALIWRTWNILVDNKGQFAFIPNGFPKDFLTSLNLFDLTVAV
jgi:hypothetical protein